MLADFNSDGGDAHFRLHVLGRKGSSPPPTSLYPTRFAILSAQLRRSPPLRPSFCTSTMEPQKVFDETPCNSLGISNLMSPRGLPDPDAGKGGGLGCRPGKGR